MRKRIIIFTFAALLALLLVLILFVRGVFFPHTDPIEGPESIAELTTVRLGGMEQYILLRGRDRRNPVLLWLHGGPGSAQMPVAHHYDQAIEEEFVVVHWDQRGAGKSNHRGFEESSMTFERFVQDAHELIEYLQQRFGEDKVLLLGHSWGAQLGLELAARYPGDLHAYIGVSQVVDNYRACEIGYAWLQERIEEQGREGARERLQALGPPPYTDHADYVAYARLIGRFGGNFDVPMGRLARIALRAPEYSLPDYLRWFDGARRGSGPMWPEVFARRNDFIAAIPSLEVPVYFLSGRRDYNTPYALVKAYAERLEAPRVELIPFEHSAHTPFLGEPEKFDQTLIRIKKDLGLEGDGRSRDPFAAYLDERVPALMRTYDIPGVIITSIEDGKTAWSRAYGYADLESGRRMTTDTYCRVESISKSVTAWGVLRLVEQGLVDLDAPVQRYLSDWTFPPSDYPAEDITVRQLLSHSAGLELGTIGVRYAPGAPRPALPEALSRDAVLRQAPGEGFSYSNVGFNLLELLIESVTGRDFADYMREEVLRPLGMEHAGFDWQPSFQPPVANGYDQDGAPIPVYVYPERASGGLFARADDIAAFVAAGMPDYAAHGRRVLTAAGIEQLYTPVLDIGGAYGLVYDAYGLGHFIEWLPGGEKSVAHGGQGSGWMTHFQSVPATGDGIVILTNSQRSWPFFGHVLSDWARGKGLGSVGMGKIVGAARALWVLIALFFLLAGWQLVRLARDWRAGRRRLAPLAGEGRGRRLAQGGGGGLIVALLFWAARQPYLFFSAVFPVATPWLGGALSLLAGALILSALLPRRGEDHSLVRMAASGEAGLARNSTSSPVRN